LYRESNLRQPADRVALAPATARASGLADGARAWLEIAGERRSVLVALDPGLPPRVVKVAARDVGNGLLGKVVPA
jgi:anaerobic selenocysteine-containing dehydrogenase